VGGASWTVGYKEAVEAVIEAVIPSNVPVILPSNPRTLVATGAAILSAGRVKINDRLSRSLGIEVETSANGNHADSGVRDGSHPSPPRPTRQRNLMDRILERNSHYETPASVTYRNSEDNQERVRISVYEGEHLVAQDNIFLGQFHIDGVTPAPKGTIPIKVTVTADTSGVVQIAAQELGRGTGSEVLGAEPIGKQLLVRERRNWTDKQIEKMAALVSKRFPEKVKVPVAPADQERPRKKRKR
jgi:molecular chaperone DnaK (HSP70)